jgi:putative oxygen-independent coproporphyrinogen III oxidase
MPLSYSTDGTPPAAARESASGERPTYKRNDELGMSDPKTSPPPLALYIHLPWCIRKCPYCDFNSHASPNGPPESPYVAALLVDLAQDLTGPAAGRPLVSIFIGGGTPSLFSGAAIARLLDGVRRLVELAPDAEITLEANPGSADAANFAAYRAAGVNRLSIGVQSLDAGRLKALGRIHDPDQAGAAVHMARAAGFDNLNLDLMYALPGQTLGEAAADLDAGIALGPEHLSYYQLTLEPNTPFHRAPPPLPDDDLAADMHDQGADRLTAAGFGQYEVSAYARPGRRCRHNINYWEFGDYLGVGAGAHAKLTDPATGRIERSAKQRHPDAYLAAVPDGAFASTRRTLDPDDLVLEFALFALRLNAGFDPMLFEQRTGLPYSAISARVEAARGDGLLEPGSGMVRPTAFGLRFLNDLVARFGAA